jgi:DNA-binding MarR family transcriptional regulator
MNSTAAQPTAAQSIESRYRDNFPRHVLEVSRYLQTRMMDTLQEECGHKDLRLGFAPYITLIGERTCRPTELAEVLGITRQACNQAIRQIEAAGYVAQTPDPQDGRARLLALTKQGRKLRRDGVVVVSGLDLQFVQLVSKPSAITAARSLAKLTNALGLAGALLEDEPVLYSGLGGFLPRLSDYVYHRLMILTQAKGHPGLKLSFGQVLLHIGPDGGRIQKIAAIQDVSKQAISVIVAELEALGYLHREADPDDARQIVLRFTEQGKSLIRDSVASVSELESEFAEMLGGPAMLQLAATFGQLFQGLGLGLEQEMLESRGEVDITLLAQQLLQQLGVQRSLALGRLLTTHPENER